MVEWKKIGSVCTVITPPKKLKKECYQKEGLYPIIDQGQSDIVGYTDDEESLLTSDSYVLFGDHTRYVKYISGKFAQGADGLKILKCDSFLNSKYFYYTFSNSSIPTRGYSRHWSIAKDIEIPIPPLSEQNRIVGILDTFTESIENLKNQITERKKQYEHYRDQLLDLEGKPGVEMKAMGEIGSFIRGSGIQKSDFVEKGFPCIHYGQVHTKYGLSATSTISFINESLFKKCKKAVKGDIVIATTSEDAEGVAKPVAWLGNEEVAISGDAYIFHHNQNGKFIAHLFVSHRFMLFKVKYATGTKVVRISGDSMAKFIVPLPSLSEQQHIVSILDTFEASIANLEQQLSLRQKQYEYYRNMLLTFDE